MPSSVTVGIDVGGTKILAGVLDSSGDGVVQRSARRPTPSGGEAVVSTICEMIGDILEPGEVLASAGMGIPGIVDRSGTLRFGPHLPGVTDYPFAEQLSERLGVPAVVTNDGTAAAYAEHQAGVGKGIADLILVTLGTGIGSGVVADGRLILGANGFAGEPGHMMIDPAGPPCPCGKRGCWERYASGTGLGRLGRDAAVAGQAARVEELAGDAQSVRGEHVTAAGREGDAEAKVILEEFGRWLGLGIANLVNVLDPAMVILGGGLIADAELVLEPARRSYASQVMGGSWRPLVPIVAASFREQAGAVGAGLLSQRHGKDLDASTG